MIYCPKSTRQQHMDSNWWPTVMTPNCIFWMNAIHRCRKVGIIPFAFGKCSSQVSGILCTIVTSTLICVMARCHVFILLHVRVSSQSFIQCITIYLVYFWLLNFKTLLYIKHQRCSYKGCFTLWLFKWRGCGIEWPNFVESPKK